MCGGDLPEERRGPQLAQLWDARVRSRPRRPWGRRGWLTHGGRRLPGLASNGRRIKEDEKAFIRAKLLELLVEPDDPVAVQLITAASKVARQDFPEKWCGVRGLSARDVARGR